MTVVLVGDEEWDEDCRPQRQASLGTREESFQPTLSHAATLDNALVWEIPCSSTLAPVAGVAGATAVGVIATYLFAKVLSHSLLRVVPRSPKGQRAPDKADKVDPAPTPCPTASFLLKARQEDPPHTDIIRLPGTKDTVEFPHNKVHKGEVRALLPARLPTPPQKEYLSLCRQQGTPPPIVPTPPHEAKTSRNELQRVLSQWRPETPRLPTPPSPPPTTRPAPRPKVASSPPPSPRLVRSCSAREDFLNRIRCGERATVKLPEKKRKEPAKRPQQTEQRAEQREQHCRATYFASKYAKRLATNRRKDQLRFNLDVKEDVGSMAELITGSLQRLLKGTLLRGESAEDVARRLARGEGSISSRNTAKRIRRLMQGKGAGKVSQHALEVELLKAVDDRSKLSKAATPLFDDLELRVTAFTEKLSAAQGDASLNPVGMRYGREHIKVPSPPPSL
eukprot:Sspe_Gene.60103::Locus_33079_Transcript_1_1_Confidence_1.000_Length_1452::g.60103::m.60103